MTGRTALLVIDVQSGLMNKQSFRREDVLNTITTLLQAARTADIPVIYIQHDGPEGSGLEPETPGWQIHPAVAPAPDEPILRKSAPDPLYQTPLQALLDSKNITHLVIVGCRTQYCIDTTCRVAVSRGFHVTLVADAHSTVDSDVCSAEQIVAHHNETLDDFGNNEHVVTVLSSGEIDFMTRERDTII